MSENEEETEKGTDLEVRFEYNGQLDTQKVTQRQKIESAWRRALAHFGISPGDVGNHNLALFSEGNELDRSNTFLEAGIPSGALLRISPRVQRAG